MDFFTYPMAEPGWIIGGWVILGVAFWHFVVRNTWTHIQADPEYDPELDVAISLAAERAGTVSSMIAKLMVIAFWPALLGFGVATRCSQIWQSMQSPSGPTA